MNPENGRQGQAAGSSVAGGFVEQELQMGWPRKLDSVWSLRNARTERLEVGMPQLSEARRRKHPMMACSSGSPVERAEEHALDHFCR